MFKLAYNCICCVANNPFSESNYEKQVYAFRTIGKGTTTVDLHSNYSFIGNGSAMAQHQQIIWIDGRNPVPGTEILFDEIEGFFIWEEFKACFHKRRENISGRLRYQPAV